MNEVIVACQWHWNVFIISEEKSVVAERFIRTFKCKINKHMTSISKNAENFVSKAVEKYNKPCYGKILNSNLVVMWENQTTQILLQRATLQNGFTKTLWSCK